jgi:HD superfamily phosphohydrolase
MTASPLQTRSRTIRDPIHGDVELTPLQAAIVDTRHFQRLRYIRQNGLLHFIFPGAVHTRFAHSLGTMEVARRAFRHLVGGLRSNGSADAELAYVETAFQLAALLHDVGHCAFSHAIEQVRIKGQPIFGTVAEFLGAWQQQELLALLQERALQEPALPQEAPQERRPQGAGLAEGPALHELIGLVLIRRIFTQARVRRAAGALADELCTDIQALVHGGLPMSQRFRAAAGQLWEQLASSQGVPATERADAARQILQVLHELISGTLDVDRLDYLVRDSFHCGVPYGCCDVEFLLSSLRIGFAEGRAVLAVSEKAQHALEDMLWSRYQLFVQVLHHKTNVGLNATLQQAMEDAVRDARIELPDSEPRLLAFTDDYVMANIHRASLLGELEDRSYTKALIDRRLPVHLGALSLVGVEPAAQEARISEYKAQLAAAQQLSEADVWPAKARSNLIKPGALFLWAFQQRGRSETSCRNFEFSSLHGALEHHVVHFFVDRDICPAVDRG